VVVTGGNRGLGHDLVRGFARAGASTVLVTRDLSRGEVAAEQVRSALRASTPGHLAQIRVEQADLGDLASVRALAERLAAAPGGVHALVNNAAQLFQRRQVDDAGVERSVAVNHLGPSLLTGLLLPTLRAHAPAAVVNLSTGSVRFGHLEDLQSAARFSPHRAYATSKLADLAGTVELAAALEGSGVRVLAVDPGAMRTGMGEDMPGVLGFVNRRIKPDQQPREITAATVVRAASVPALGTGVWLDRRGVPVRLPRSIRDPKTRREVWRETQRLIGPLPG